MIREEMERVKRTDRKAGISFIFELFDNAGFPEVYVLRTDPPLTPGAAAKLSPGTGGFASAAQPLTKVKARTGTWYMHVCRSYRS